MAEFFTTAQIATLSARQVRVAFLVKFDFVSGAVRAWNGDRKLVALDGKEYLPTYGYGSIDGIGLGGGTQSNKVTFQLSGIPGDRMDFLAKALEDTPQITQQLVTVYLQLFTDEWQPQGVPIVVFRGFMQPPSISRSAGTQTDAGVQTITLVAENIFYGRARPPFGRYTDRDQQARYDGDKFFGFVSSLLYKKITYPDY